MNNAGILGIKNRTENWKTACHFAPFFRDGAARLRLAKRLGAPEDTKAEDVRIELFWYGMRDHLHRKDEPVRNNPRLFEMLADRYGSLFPDLRRRIEVFDPSGNELRLQQDWNYSPKNAKDTLASNLINTEIDVVIDTPTLLFIGEAKEESGLDGNGQYVLVHQLIRQYVMAWILVVLTDSNKKVVPFVVGANEGQVQVQFMQCQGWLPKRNAVCWECVKSIAVGKGTCCQ